MAKPMAKKSKTKTVEIKVRSESAGDLIEVIAAWDESGEREQDIDNLLALANRTNELIEESSEDSLEDEDGEEEEGEDGEEEDGEEENGEEDGGEDGEGDEDSYANWSLTDLKNELKEWDVTTAEAKALLAKASTKDKQIKKMAATLDALDAAYEKFGKKNVTSLTKLVTKADGDPAEVVGRTRKDEAKVELLATWLAKNEVIG